MKTILSALFVLSLSPSAFAQFTEIATSPEFEEPTAGHLKIITTDAGETFLLHIDGKDFNLKKYDRNHKLVQEKTMQSIYGDFKRGNILNATSEGEYITLFNSEMDSRTLALYRQVIDTKNCTFKEEKKIDSMPKIKIKVGTADASSRLINRKFEYYVKTDPATGAYATAAYFTDQESEKQLRIQHYDKNHNILSSSCFYLPDSKYLYYDYKGMHVDGDKAVILVAVAATEKTGKLFFAKLPAGATTFEAKAAVFPGATDIDDVVIRYNKATGQYVSLCTRIKEGSGSTFRVVWDTNRDTVITEPITGAMLTSGIKYKHMSTSLAKPTTQKMTMNEDGSYTAVFEDIGAKANTYNSAGRAGSPSGSFTSLKIYMNNVAVSDFDKDGKIVSTKVLPKSHQIGMFSKLGPYNLAEIEQEGMQFSSGTQFKTFCYLPIKNKEYILFVDDEENQGRIDKRNKPETVVGLENCRSYVMTLNTEDTKPTRSELFKEEVSRKNRPLIIPALSSYNKATEEVATLKVNYETKKACLSWLKAE